MTIATNATILRYEADTDKCWVIIPNAGSNGNHLVFFGSTNWDGKQSGSLQEREVDGESWKRTQDKERKGYKKWEGVSFDTENHVVVQSSSSTSQPKSKQRPSFWYRINAVETEEIEAHLADIRKGLMDNEIGQDYVDEFDSMKLVADLRSGSVSGSQEYRESPLLVLLLFSLKRKLGTKMMISDDNNELLPESFKEMSEMAISIRLFIPMPGSQVIIPPAHEAIKELGVAMLCIGKPIDLSKIETSSQAAFF